eukprot:SAG31_NODE_1864_length_7036_cov_3.477584_4_plen_94_part_00
MRTGLRSHPTDPENIPSPLSMDDTGTADAKELPNRTDTVDKVATESGSGGHSGDNGSVLGDLVGGGSMPAPPSSAASGVSGGVIVPPRPPLKV